MNKLDLVICNVKLRDERKILSGNTKLYRLPKKVSRLYSINEIHFVRNGSFRLTISNFEVVHFSKGLKVIRILSTNKIRSGERYKGHGLFGYKLYCYECKSLMDYTQKKLPILCHSCSSVNNDDVLMDNLSISKIDIELLLFKIDLINDRCNNLLRRFNAIKIKEYMEDLS